MNDEMSIEDLFANLGTLPWNHEAYFPADSPLMLQTRCLILDPNDVEAFEDIPAAAATRGWTRSLSITDVRSVERNAKQQGREPTKREFLQALSYYLDHDAFIDFRKN